MAIFILLCLIFFIQSKKDSGKAVFLGEGIFTMGLVKTIYNVLGGFYSDYNSIIPTESVHKLNKSLKFFLCTFSPSFFILPIFVKNMHKKTGFLTPGFVFVNFRSIKLRLKLPGQLLRQQVFLQKVLQIPLSRSFLSLKGALHNDLIHHDALK